MERPEALIQGERLCLGRGPPTALSGTEICRGTRSHGANVRAWTCQVQSLSYTCLLPVLTYFYHLINYYFVSLQCVQLLAIRKVLGRHGRISNPWDPLCRVGP